MPSPGISVVCAADDHPPDLDLWFGSLMTQQFAPDGFEVIVADSLRQAAYADALERARKEHGPQPAITYLALPPSGRAAALNAALDRAVGSLVIFLGDDYVPGPTFVAAHHQFHEEHPERTAVGVGAAFLGPPFANPFSLWLERSGQLYGIPVFEDMDTVAEDFFFVGNASVKRELLDAVGPFDEEYPFHAWDDYEMGLRLRDAGMRAEYVPGARSEHHHHIDLEARKRNMWQAGVSARLFEATRPGEHSWTPVVAHPPLRHQLSAWARLARFALTRSEGERERYYRRSLDAAFDAGYRSAGTQAAVVAGASTGG